MARCPAHGNRIQLNPSKAVNLFGATPQTDCRRTFDHRLAQGVDHLAAHGTQLAIHPSPRIQVSRRSTPRWSGQMPVLLSACASPGLVDRSIGETP